MPTDLTIERTASTLLRRYGARARAEAFTWCRHFATTGDTAEKRIWTRIAWTIRATARNDNTAPEAG